jgi:uncharacterized protein YjbJ (UPF0337 family)
VIHLAHRLHPSVSLKPVVLRAAKVAIRDRNVAFVARGVDYRNSLSRRTAMSGKSDEMKGRLKKAAGELTGNNKLKREGSIDKAAGKVKQGVDKVKDAVKKANRK